MAEPTVVYQGYKLNKRTLAMLKAAETVAPAGSPWTIYQGSYNKGGTAASAGTHDGGGAVDVSPYNWQERVRALRTVGFAAWHRPAIPKVWGEHIHAIAIGDPELSDAAAKQIPDYYAGRDALLDNGPDPGPKVAPIQTWDDYLAAKAALIDAADAAYPLTDYSILPDSVKVFCGYVGRTGCTPHIWTPAEADAARKAVGNWWPVITVHSYAVDAAYGQGTAAEMIAALPKYGLRPNSTPVFLDVEHSTVQASAQGAIDCVAAWKSAMEKAGWPRAYAYCSSNVPGPRWTPNWTYTRPTSVLGLIGIQYAGPKNDPRFDLNVFDGSLLPQAPAPAPQPLPVPVVKEPVVATRKMGTDDHQALTVNKYHTLHFGKNDKGNLVSVLGPGDDPAGTFRATVSLWMKGPKNLDHLFLLPYAIDTHTLKVTQTWPVRPVGAKPLKHIFRAGELFAYDLSDGERLRFQVRSPYKGVTILQLAVNVQYEKKVA